MDWCEENYIVSFYIAEWWNTLTNLNYMVLALIGLWSARKTKSELRCYLPYIGLFVIGVGISKLIWKLSKTNPGHTRELAIILTVAISGYLIAFGFWNTDNLACDQLRELRGKIGILSVFLQFHGWWHMWTGLSAYCLYLLANYMRLITQGNKDVYVKWFGPYPVILTNREVVEVSADKKPIEV
ncbi:Alkaline ceramidase 3 [Globomyces sp. JEL0801]|nr:Alkaline ceramidase 3 [Globomyces sp. JEL0801]